MTGETGHTERGRRDDRQRTERRGHRPQTDRRSSRAPAGGTAPRTPDLSRLVPTAVSVSLSVVLSRQGCSSSFRPQRETNPGPTPASRDLERRALRLAGCRLRTGGRAALRVLPQATGATEVTRPLSGNARISAQVCPTPTAMDGHSAVKAKTSRAELVTQNDGPAPGLLRDFPEARLIQ